MGTAITVGMFAWAMLVIGGIVGVLAVIYIILSIIGEGFKH